MKKSNRILSILLAITLVIGMFTVSASAASSTPTREVKAQALSALGLFRGYDDSGKNFGLNDRATREQTLIILIRMLGLEKDALAWTGSQPYTDVPANSWARPYIGYAKQEGLTVGVGKNKFGMGIYARMDEMATFALRGLGYSDLTRPADFTVPGSVAFAKKIGMLDSSKIVTPFTRGEAVDIVFGSIATNLKGKDYDLLSKLMNNGAVTQAQYDKAMAIVGGTTVTTPTTKVDPTSVTLDKTALTLAVGETYDLTAKLAPTNSKISLTWSSSSSSVATVGSSGIVKGVKAGTATVTVKTHNGKTATCKVTVTAATDKYTDKTVNLYNSTNQNVTDIRISSTQNKHWGSNLTSGTVKPNAKTTILVPVSSTDYTYDIKITYADGSDATFAGYNFKTFTSGGSLYAYINNGTPILSTTKPGAAVDTAAASKALTSRFNKALDRYNALVTELNKYDSAKTDNLVKTVNSVSSSLEDMGKVIGEGTGTYTEAQIKEYNTALNSLDSLMNELDKLLEAAKAEASKPTSITAPITLVNNTGVNIAAVYMTSQKDSRWGSSLGSIGKDTSGTTNVTFTSDALIWDLRIEDSDGNYIDFHNIDFTKCSVKGGTITLTYDGKIGTATTNW